MKRPTVPIWWTKAQDRLSSLLGCAPEERDRVVEAMIRAGPSESAGYWLQLSLAVGIATMGLVLDSGAVVIAAMLVAPLMGPIVALGMALAIGSPYLVLRSAVRVGLSVALGVGASALIVLALPFHVTTAEIEARTLPTALDLVTAGFCAFAGVYATMRPTSDVASTAAGTSIGISLVPPLCASGYGLGIADHDIAGGAALLFVTNLVAIVVVATLAFAAFGFTRVDVAGLERDTVADERPASPIATVARRIARRIGPRGGLGLRLAMPLVLLGLVYLPLRAALDEVAWQISVRNRLEQALGELDEEVLESRVRVERNAIDVALVLIGTPAEADAVRSKLDEEARSIADVAPRISVYAVPDATDFAGLAEELRRPPPVVPVVQPPPPPPEPTPSERIEAGLGLIEEALARRWPTKELGRVLSTAVQRDQDGYAVTVVHHGPAIDPATRAVVESVLSDDLGVETMLDARSIPSRVIVPTDSQVVREELAVAVQRAVPVEAMWLCVEQPPEPPGRRGRKSAPDPVRELVLGTIAGFPRLDVVEANAWSIRFVLGEQGCRANTPRPE